MYLSYTRSRDCIQISQELHQIKCCHSPLISMKHGTRQIVPSQTFNMTEGKVYFETQISLLEQCFKWVISLASEFCTGRKTQSIARAWTCGQNLPGAHTVSAFLCIHELVFPTRILARDVRDVFAWCHPFPLAEGSSACQALVPIGIMGHIVTQQLGSFPGYLTLGKSLGFSGLHFLSCEPEVLRSLRVLCN